MYDYAPDEYPRSIKKIASLSKCKSASKKLYFVLKLMLFFSCTIKQFFCDKVDITMREQYLLECYNRNSAIFKLSKMIYQRLGTLTENKKERERRAKMGLPEERNASCKK